MSDTDLLVDELRAIVGDDYVVHLPEDLIVFEYDGSVDKAMPSAVVLPASTEEVSAVVSAASRAGVPIVARGRGHRAQRGRRRRAGRPRGPRSRE